MALGDITIDTTVTPSVTINPLTKSAGSQSIPLALLRPSFDIDLGTGTVYHYSPYGEPTGTITAGVIVGAILILALMFWLGYRLK